MFSIAPLDRALAMLAYFVKVADGNFDNDPVTYQTNSLLWVTPTIRSLELQKCIPKLILKLQALTEAKTMLLALTLYQTAKNDENGEKLLYNPQKQEELQAILPGQAVPIATKGIFTLSSAAFRRSNHKLYAPGNRNKSSSATTAGKVTGFAYMLAIDNYYHRRA